MLNLTFPSGGALVAGGTGNVGAGVVRRLAQAGVPVVFTYRRNTDAARALEAQVRDAGGQAFAQAMDMDDARSIQSAIDAVLEKTGRLHTVACAGGPFVRVNRMNALTPDEISAFVQSDAIGIFRLVHTALPALRAGGGGSITVCSTIANRRVIEFDGISPFSKAAVEALVRQIAYEEGPSKIRCNAVPVAWVYDHKAVDTNKAREQIPNRELFAAIVKQISGSMRSPQPQPTPPDEAGNLFTFLASEQARCITGQIIAIDDGATL
jgi:NAD(P)-dependent dehydrogenase (short-subunit alcohol dehydrogenase family)